jgi:hypothetical protein
MSASAVVLQTTMVQMSITQGLAELKLLQKRINKGLDGVSWMALNTKTKKVDEEELKKRALSEYQSFMDLVKRRDSIKRAIVLANATTNVTIGKKWTGTVAEAIEHKTSLAFKKLLLEKMKDTILDVEREHTNAVEETTSRLDRLLSSELGKDVKTNPETIASLTASFQESNKVVVLDPLDLRSKARELEEEIDAFETNVDWVLSETNSKTMIKLHGNPEEKLIPKFPAY